MSFVSKPDYPFRCPFRLHLRHLVAGVGDCLAEGFTLAFGLTESFHELRLGLSA